MTLSFPYRCRNLSLRLMERFIMRASKNDTTSAMRGLRGENAVFFYLSCMGWTIVARRWRSSHGRGELDLVAWEGDTLCFVEVKTRTQRGIVPAEFAVDEHKQRMLKRTAAAYISRLPREMEKHWLRVRFDVASVYLLQDATADEKLRSPHIDLFRDAFQ